MVKRRSFRPRRRRIATAINGFISSFTRTIINVYFIGISVVSYYIFQTSNSLSSLVTALNKIASLKFLASWINSHHKAASAAIYLLALSFFVVPPRFSLAYALISVVLIYYLPQADDFVEYLGLAIFMCWFARTSSQRLRVFIIFLAAILIIKSIWGSSFFSS